MVDGEAVEDDDALPRQRFRIYNRSPGASSDDTDRSDAVEQADECPRIRNLEEAGPAGSDDAGHSDSVKQAEQ